MWRALVRRVKTTQTLNIPTEQDSEVSLAIIRAKDFNDIIQAATVPNSKLGNITFAFRMLSRSLKSNKTNMKVFKEDSFRTMINTVRDNIENIDSQGICDILFWSRVAQGKNVNSFNKLEILRIINRVEDHLKSSSFNSKQLINMYFDIAQIKFYSYILETKIEELVSDRNQIFNHVDYQNILISASKLNRTLSKRISKTMLDRIYVSNLSSEDIEALTGYLSVIANHFNRYYFDPKLAEFVDNLKIAVLENMNNITANEAKTIIEFYEKFPMQDTQLLDECIKRLFYMLKHSPNSFTNFNFKYLAGYLTSLNRTSQPFSCPPEMRFILKDLIIKRIANRKPEEFIYELVCALGLLGIQLKPEEQKLVLNSIIESDLKGLFPFHFSRMLSRVGIEDIEFLFKKYDQANCKYEKEKILLINDACQILKQKEIPIIREILENVFEETLKQISHFSLNKFSSYLKAYSMHNSSRKYNKVIVEKILTVLEEDGGNLDPIQKIKVALDVMEYNPELSISFISRQLSDNKQNHLIHAFRKYEDSCSFENMLRIVHLTGRNRADFIPVLISRCEELKEHKLTAAFLKLLDEYDHNLLSDTIFLENVEELFDKIEEESWCLHLQNFLKKLNRELHKCTFYGLDFKYITIAGHLARLNELDPDIASKIVHAVKPSNHPDIYHYIYIASAAYNRQSKAFKDKLFSHVFTANQDYNFPIMKRKLQAFLKWPEYEGEAEDKYAEDLSNRIKSLKCNNLYPAFDLIASIQEIYPSFVHENLGRKLLNTMTSKISTELPNIAISCMPFLLRAFYRNANNVDSEFYKLLFDRFEDKFEYMSDYSKNEIIRCMAFNGLKFESSIDKIVKDMYDYPMNYIPGNYLSILESLSDLNILEHRDRLLDESLQRLPASENTKEFTKEHSYIRWMWSLIHMNADRQILESYAKLYNPDSLLPTFLFKKLLAYKYFELNNIPFGHQEERENLQKRHQPFMSFGFLPHWFKEMESKLTEKDLKFHTFVNGNYIPALHVPTQTAIWPVSNLVEIHKQKQLKGAFIMHKKFIEESGLKLSMPSGYGLKDMTCDEMLNSIYDRSS